MFYWLRQKRKQFGIIINTMHVAFCTLVGQIAIIIVLPFLSRLYTPSDFGVLGAYISLLSVVSVFSCFQYQMAIPLPKRTREAAGLVVVSFGLLIFVVTTASLCCFFQSELLAKNELYRAANEFLWLLPVGIFFTGGYSIVSNWAIRKKNYSTLAYSKLSQGVGSAVVQVSMGVASVGVLGLLVGGIISKSSGLFSLARGLYLDIKKYVYLISAVELWMVLKKYRDFPLFGNPTSILNTLYWELPVFFFTTMFSPEIGGAFFMSFRVVNAPISLITGSISNVFLGDIAQDDVSLIGKKFPPLLNLLLAVSVIPFCLFATIANAVLPYILGTSWGLTSQYTELLVLSAVGVLFFSPFSIVFQVVRKLNTAFWFHAVSLFFLSVGLYIGYSINDALLAVKLYTIVTLCSRVIAIYTLCVVLGVSSLQISFLFIQYALLGGGVLVIGKVLAPFLGWWVAFALLSMMIYFKLLYSAMQQYAQGDVSYA